MEDEKKALRRGYTTGTCAAAAAKAAAWMLLGGGEAAQVVVTLPAGEKLLLEVEAAAWEGEGVSCAVRKDAGDDPDVTDGVLVFAAVCRAPGEGVVLEGGPGVGRVTKPGLRCPVGGPAINPVPRRMIEAAVGEARARFGYTGGLRVAISIPGGEALAARTYNPRLGIVGGLSVLGTTGYVEPMSQRALIDTIGVQLDVLRAAGARVAALAPGNYGAAFLRESLRIDLEKAVKCGNFVGEALDMAARRGFEGVLLAGHLGKLCKVAGGSMNTHSALSDARMETLSAHAALCGAGRETVGALLGCATTDGALEILRETGLCQAAMASLLERCESHLARRLAAAAPAGQRPLAGAVTFSLPHGLLGMSPGAGTLLARLREGQGTGAVSGPAEGLPPLGE